MNITNIQASAGGDVTFEFSQSRARAKRLFLKEYACGRLSDYKL